MNSKWEWYFQEESTPNMIGIRDLHDEIIFIMIWILTIVIVMSISILKDTNINLIKNSHNSLIEFIWTIIPAVILVMIAIPSYKLMYTLDEVIKPLITLKVQGSQWYWTYNINDSIEVEFTSYPKDKEELLPGEINYLEVDKEVILPILTPIRVLITSNDVMHAWAVPALGIKIDAIPGKINHGMIYMLKKGKYYGQCSELCGLGHSYMPIVIKGVTNNRYINWLFTFSEIKWKDYINFIKIL